MQILLSIYSLPSPPSPPPPPPPRSMLSVCLFNCVKICEDRKMNIKAQLNAAK